MQATVTFDLSLEREFEGQQAAPGSTGHGSRGGRVAGLPGRSGAGQAACQPEGVSFTYTNGLHEGSLLWGAVVMFLSCDISGAFGSSYKYTHALIYIISPLKFHPQFYGLTSLTTIFKSA